MAVALYSAWLNAGKPLHPCRPLREFLAAMKAAYPPATFSYHSNDAHYKANFPEDHTPFSRTYWPIEPPVPWTVTATDIMQHRAYSLDELVAFWWAEARADRFTSLAYMIYKNRVYSALSDFRSDPYRGEYHTHIHLSFRTDYEKRGLEGWSPIPGGDVSEEEVLAALSRGKFPAPKLWRNPANKTMSVITMLRGGVDEIIATRDALTKAAAASAAAGEKDRLRDEALMAFLKAGGGDTGVAAAVQAVKDATRLLGEEYRDQIAELGEQITALRADLAERDRERDELLSALAEARRREADALAAAATPPPPGVKP